MMGPPMSRKQQTAPAEDIAAVLAAAFMRRAEIQNDAAELQAVEASTRSRRKLAAWLLLAATIAMILAAAIAPARAMEFTVKSAGTPFVVKSAKTATPAAAKHAAGEHSHRCPIDGRIWTHGAEEFGKDASHRCPKCGRLEWEVYEPKAAATPPAFLSAGGCPGGICPTPTRRGRR